MMQADRGRTGRAVTERALRTRTPEGGSGRDGAQTIGAGIRHGSGHVVGTSSTPAWAG
ncbi:hypothetical protein [Geodermatophilus sp. URMC 65]|jgi:hypothetical protein